jgi:hypothetical protein
MVHVPNSLPPVIVRRQPVETRLQQGQQIQWIPHAVRLPSAHAGFCQQVLEIILQIAKAI